MVKSNRNLFLWHIIRWSMIKGRVQASKANQLFYQSGQFETVSHWSVVSWYILLCILVSPTQWRARTVLLGEGSGYLILLCTKTTRMTAVLWVHISVRHAFLGNQSHSSSSSLLCLFGSWSWLSLMNHRSSNERHTTKWKSSHVQL